MQKILFESARYGKTEVQSSSELMMGDKMFLKPR